MLLSIIVPCYNAGSSIQLLLESISNQLLADCELILIDDGSTDQTGQIIKEFIDQTTSLGEISLIQTENAGATKARERGLGIASGEFIYFCDSDDIFHDGFITTFKKYLHQYPDMEILLISADMAVETDGVLKTVAPKVKYPEVLLFGHGYDLLEYNLQNEMYTAAVWTYIPRRRIIEGSSAGFTARKAHEDHLYTLNALMQSSVLVAAPECMYTQKIRMGSLTNSTKDLHYIVERIDAYNEAHEFLMKTKFKSIYLYEKWSFDSIWAILRQNKHLLPGLLMNKTGLTYLIKCWAFIMQLAIQKVFKP